MMFCSVEIQRLHSMESLWRIPCSTNMTCRSYRVEHKNLKRMGIVKYISFRFEKLDPNESPFPAKQDFLIDNANGIFRKAVTEAGIGLAKRSMAFAGYGVQKSHPSRLVGLTQKTRSTEIGF